MSIKMLEKSLRPTWMQALLSDIRAPVEKVCAQTQVDSDDFWDVPLEAQFVSEKLKNAEISRRQEQVTSQLREIHERITQALIHVGVDPDLSTSEEDKTHLALSSPQTFDVKEKRRKKEGQRLLLEMIADYEALCTKRRTLLQKIADWLDSADDLGEVPNEQLLNEKKKLYKEIDDNILDAFDYSQQKCDDLKQLAKELLTEAGFVDSENEDEEERLRKKELQRRTTLAIVLDDQTINSDSTNFDVACQEVKYALENSIRFAKKNVEKNAMRLGLRQFKYLMKAMVYRQQQAKEKCDENLELELKLREASKKLEWHQNEAKQSRQKIKKQESQLKKMQEMIEKLTNDYQNLKLRLDEIESELRASTRSHSIVTLSKESLPIKSEHSLTHTGDVLIKKSSRKLTDSSNNTQNQQTEQLKVEVTEQQKKIGQLEQKLSKRDETIAKLSARLDIASKSAAESRPVVTSKEPPVEATNHLSSKLKTLSDANDELKIQVARLKEDVKFRDELINFQEKSLNELKNELEEINWTQLSGENKPGKKTKTGGGGAEAAMKKIVNRLKNENDFEIRRLKQHHEKEKQRLEAQMRKLEATHGDQLSAIHKESVHLLRAINRFKEATAVILDRESLPSAAQDIRALADLRTAEGQNPTETRMLLGQMAGSAVELLVTIEFKLSQSLMNKRIEVKDASIAKSFAAKDLMAQSGIAQKSKQTAEYLAEKLKDVRKKLIASEEGIKEIRKQDNARYQTLSVRYKRLWGQYSNLHNEMSRLQRDYAETVRRRDCTMRSMLSSRESMARVVEEQQMMIGHMSRHMKQRNKDKERALYLNLSDQQKNIELIEMAYKEKLISQQMHQMTIDVIKRAMDLPLIKIRQFFNRYIVFRRLKDAKEELKEKIQSSSDSQKNLHETFLHNMDDQIEKMTRQMRRERELVQMEQRALRASLADTILDVMEVTGYTLALPDDTDSRQLTTAMLGAISPSGEYAARPAPTTTLHSHSASQARAQRPARLELEHRRAGGTRSPPSEMVGRHIPQPSEERRQRALWKIPDLLPPIVTKSHYPDTSRLIDMDVNHRMRSAFRALKRCQRLPLEVAQVDGVDYQTTIVQSLRQVVTKAPMSDLSQLHSSLTDTTDETLTNEIKIPT